MSKFEDLAVRRNIIVLLLAVLVLAVGCGRSTEVKLDADDNGRQIELEKGQILVAIISPCWK